MAFINIKYMFLCFCGFNVNCLCLSRTMPTSNETLISLFFVTHLLHLCVCFNCAFTVNLFLLFSSLLSIHLFYTKPFACVCVCVLAQVIQAYRTLIIAFKSNVAATGAQVCIMHTQLFIIIYTYFFLYLKAHTLSSKHEWICTHKDTLTHSLTHMHYSHFRCVFLTLEDTCLLS